jgi:hypothetical protein
MGFMDFMGQMVAMGSGEPWDAMAGSRKQDAGGFPPALAPLVG